jgi:hypothetical protein
VIGEVRRAVVIVCLVAAVAPARAQTFETQTSAAQTSSAPSVPADQPSIVASTLLFFTGAAAGLAIHESGHVLFGAIFDANPRVAPLHYGFIPFFKIDHDPVTRREEFVISSAGFWMQYVDSEWILTKKPDLRHEHQPLLKGIFAFDLGASAVYSIAAFGEFGPPERDTRGMAVSLGRDGWPEPIVGAIVLAPAALDGYRYFHPDAAWAKWASRGAKIASVVLVAAAGRED